MQVLDYEGLQELSTNIRNLSNYNILINPNFRVNQRDGYVVKEGAVVYGEKEFTTPANTSILPGYAVINIYDDYATTFTKNAEVNFTIYCKTSDIQKGYTGKSIYTVDRWKFNDYDSNLLTIHDSYVTLTSINTDTYKQILQKIDNWQDYVGETLTLSVKLRVPQNTRAYIQMNCGSRNTAVEVTDTNGEWKVVTAKLSVDDNANRLYVGVGIYEYSSGSVDIKWAKLEVGNIATPYVPPIPSIELLKCKYYYQELYTNTRLAVMNTDLLIGNIYIPNTMRILPSINFKNNRFNENQTTYIVHGNIIDGFTFEPIIDGITNEIHIRCNKSSHGLEELNTLLVVGKKNPVCLNAEL